MIDAERVTMCTATVNHFGPEKLKTTARYPRVATGHITAVESPLDQLPMPDKTRRKRGKRKDDKSA